MPPVSEAQRRAMAAAMHGDSTLGIPQSVGKEYMEADKGGKLPKRKSGKNWPAQTPAITGPGQPVGKPGPGYKADAILLHPEGRRGVPDSLSCITTNAEGFRRVMHIMHQAPDSIVPLIVV